MRHNLQRSLFVIGCLLLSTVVIADEKGQPRTPSVPTQIETRCGWLNNPTPANIWFYDRDAEWTIGVQGGYQVEKDWDWPVFKRGQWIKTNSGDHGYGCVCLRLIVNQETHQVVEIKSARARPLEACRQDRSLKKWKFK